MKKKKLTTNSFVKTLAAFIARALTRLASTEMIVDVGEADFGGFSDSYTQYNCYQIEKIV